MPWIEFETTIPAFEQAKTFHALDLAAAEIGQREVNKFERTLLVISMLWKRVLYCGVFIPCKNYWATETAVSKQYTHATIEQRDYATHF
jgi:hypothetical protein